METKPQNTCSKKFLLSVITVQSILLLLGAYTLFMLGNNSEISTTEYSFLSDSTNTLKKNNFDTLNADKKLIIATEDGKITFDEFLDIKSVLKQSLEDLESSYNWYSEFTISPFFKGSLSVFLV